MSKVWTDAVRVYDWIVKICAIIGGAILAFIFVAIIWDVSLRSLRIQPPAFTMSATEYGMLHMTVLAAPWVLREHAHVSVTTFLEKLPPAAQIQIRRIASVIAALSCAIVAYYATRATLTITGYDIRSVAVPRWTVLVTMPVGFTLLSIEFLRLAWRGVFSSELQEH